MGIMEMATAMVLSMNNMASQAYSARPDAPVVPYEYAIQNECAFPHKGGSSLQNDAIVTWTSEDANGDPHVTLPINLQSIPAGSKCKVFLVRNGNVVVKGSTTSYTVG